MYSLFYSYFYSLISWACKFENVDIVNVSDKFIEGVKKSLKHFCLEK